MGHAMHAMLSDVTYRSLAGTNVLWDFVELPSQIQENWGYTKDMLDNFARHYQTNEPIPQALIQKLNDAKNYMVGWGGLRQIGLAMLDMAWHTQTNPAKIKDVAGFEDDVLKDVTFFPREAGPMSTHFGHIFAGGYAAGYYSYKWAEVLDADAFEMFVENGLYDKKTATKYKEAILSKGGTADPSLLYRNFRGRDADPHALLRREGLDGKKKKAA
jgi:peptidyl-dipeptidase Dcp